MSQRLSPKSIKQDIRHDDLRTWLDKVDEWLTVHGQSAKIGAIVLVAAGLVTAGVLTWLDHRRASADDELAKAIETFEAPLASEVPADAKPKPKLTFASDAERLAAAKPLFEAVPGVGAGPSGCVAELYLADIAVREGNVDKAAEIWKHFLDDHEGDALAASVRLNLYRLRREKGESEQVATELRKELDQAGGDLPDDVLLFELAETLDHLGKGDEARELYQQLVDEHPQSAYTSKARQRTAEPA